MENSISSLQGDLWKTNLLEPSAWKSTCHMMWIITTNPMHIATRTVSSGWYQESLAFCTLSSSTTKVERKFSSVDAQRVRGRMWGTWGTVTCAFWIAIFVSRWCLIWSFLASSSAGITCWPRYSARLWKGSPWKGSSLGAKDAEEVVPTLLRFSTPGMDNVAPIWRFIACIDTIVAVRLVHGSWPAQSKRHQPHHIESDTWNLTFLLIFNLFGGSLKAGGPRIGCSWAGSDTLSDTMIFSPVMSLSFCNELIRLRIY